MLKSSGLFQVSVSFMSDAVKGRVDDGGLKIRIGVEGDKLDSVFATTSSFATFLGGEAEKGKEAFFNGYGTS